MDTEEAERLLVGEYSRLSEAYATHAVPQNAPLVRNLLQLVRVRRDDRVADLGCGPGNVAFEAARRVGPRGTVQGFDLAEGMIQVARALAAESDLHNLRFDIADARNLPVHDASFDVVVSCLGIPATGLRDCFREVHRILCSGGRFAFCVATGGGTGAKAGQAFHETLERLRPRRPSTVVRKVLEAREVLRNAGRTNPARDHRETLRQLREIGFGPVRSVSTIHRSSFRAVDDYIRYQLAWGDNERQWAALSDADRAIFRRRFASQVVPLTRGKRLEYTREVLYYFAAKRRPPAGIRRESHLV